MHFTINFQADHLINVLEAVRREIATPHDMLTSIGETLLPVNQHRHAQGLAPDGTKWKELSPLTIQSKRKPQMLRDQGGLLDRFNLQVSGDTLKLGTDDWKAAFHHFGTKPYVITPRKAKALKFGGMYRRRENHPGLPARQLVGFSASDQKLVLDVTDDHLKKVLNRLR
jgi:phage gpG-like protein